MENRKLEFTVTRLKCHVAKISNFSKTFIILLLSAAIFFFIKSKCITFIAQKTGINH